MFKDKVKIIKKILNQLWKRDEKRKITFHTVIVVTIINSNVTL